MTNRCDFVEQVLVGGGNGEGIASNEDARLRPDMLVQLPAQRKIVVDCKAVLGAFLESAAASTEAGSTSRSRSRIAHDREASRPDRR